MSGRNWLPREQTALPSYLSSQESAERPHRQQNVTAIPAYVRVGLFKRTAFKLNRQPTRITYYIYNANMFSPSDLLLHVATRADYCRLLRRESAAQELKYDKYQDGIDAHNISKHEDS
jgi:hypothetical protein